MSTLTVGMRVFLR